MAKDHRIEQGGKRVNCTCENARYRTDISKGCSHTGHSKYRGSVLDTALVDRNGYSLWLEHVIEIKNNTEWYWLMWYQDGLPTIPMSSVFDEKDKDNMVRLLTTTK